MALDRITVENFRGLRLFSCDRFADITILGGRNNCGKTSVLEAICILLLGNTSAIAPRVNDFRALPIGEGENLPALFFDPERDIRIEGVFTDTLRRGVRISLAYAEQEEYDEAKTDQTLSRTPMLRQTLHVDNNSAHISDVSMTFQRKAQSSEGAAAWEYSSTTELFRRHVRYLATQMPIDLTNVEHLFLAKADTLLLEPLQAFDSRIQGIQVVGKRVMVNLHGCPRLLPIQVLGDGALKLVVVLANLWACRNGGTLCADELDNGLHYSVLPLFWRSVLAFAKEQQAQLIATTHRIEMLQSLANVLGEMEDAPTFSYINLMRTQEKGNEAQDTPNVIANGYGKDEFITTVNLGLEVR